MIEPPEPPRRRGTGVVALIVLALIASFALVMVRHRSGLRGDAGVARGSDRGRVVPPALRDPRTTAVEDVLARRARAVLRRDRGAFLATVDPVLPAFRQRQDRLFTALTGVRFASWRYDVGPGGTARTVPAPGRFAGGTTYAPAVVFLRYRLADFDSEPTVTAQHLTFVRRADGWRLGADTDFDRFGARTERDVWDFGPVVTVIGRHSLVLGHPGQRRLLSRLGAEADRDVPRVSRLWGVWSQRVVVVVPDTQRELAAILGRPAASLTRIAAVATAELLTAGGASPAVGNRVLINTANIHGLGPLGLQVVLTHEITHVATRAVTAAAAPSWLVEGFADYVAYRSTHIDVPSAARELRAEVQAGRVPVALPGDRDFSGSNDRLPQVYEGAWLAVRLIAARGGEPALLRFYRAVAGPDSTDSSSTLATALQDAVHLSPSAFTAAWRTYLRTELA